MGEFIRIPAFDKVLLSRVCILAVVLLIDGCGIEKQNNVPIEYSSRVVFVGAHPDDELTSAPFFLKYAPPCALTLFTRGEGGECYLETGCGQDLGALREKEAEKSADILGCELHIGSFPNAPTSSLPVPNRISQWKSLGAEEWLENILRPEDTVISFDPSAGVTFHSEHRAAGTIALEVSEKIGVQHFYQILNPLRAMPVYNTSDNIIKIRVDDVYQDLIHLWNTAYPSQHDPFLSAALNVPEVWKTVYFRKVW